jgi:hypothetical protein
MTPLIELNQQLQKLLSQFRGWCVADEPNTMLLSIDADASYLGEADARSCGAITLKFITRDNPDCVHGLIKCIRTIIPTIVTGAG